RTPMSRHACNILPWDMTAPLRWTFQPIDAGSQLPQLRLDLIRALRRQLRTGRRTAEERAAGPPVDAHLSRLVDRRDQEPDVDREELDLDETDADVAGNHETLVEDPLEEIGERGAVGRVHDVRHLLVHPCD